MRTLAQSVPTATLVAALLAGCGGSQPFANAPSTTAQIPPGSAASSGAGRAKSHALLYVAVASGSADEVDVYTYPDGTPVQTLTGFQNISGICSDMSGNIFIGNQTSPTGGYILEYAKGGSAPIATLDDPYGDPKDCGVSHRTGNLAVANRNGSIAIYSAAQGAPTYYPTAGIADEPLSIAYDNMGNIYCFGKHHAAWLPVGTSQVQPFYFHPHAYTHGSLRQYGTFLALSGTSEHMGDGIDRYRHRGTHANKSGIILHRAGPASFWITGSTVAVVVPGTGVDICERGGGCSTITGIAPLGGVAVSP